MKKELTPIGPGEVLHDLMSQESARPSQEDLARALGVSRLTVNQLLNGKRGVTADMSLRLARAFATTAEFWLDLQRNVDLHEARSAIGSRLTKVNVIRRNRPHRPIAFG